MSDQPEIHSQNCQRQYHLNQFHRKVFIYHKESKTQAFLNDDRQRSLISRPKHDVRLWHMVLHPFTKRAHVDIIMSNEAVVDKFVGVLRQPMRRDISPRRTELTFPIK